MSTYTFMGYSFYSGSRTKILIEEMGLVSLSRSPCPNGFAIRDISRGITVDILVSSQDISFQIIKLSETI